MKLRYAYDCYNPDKEYSIKQALHREINDDTVNNFMADTISLFLSRLLETSSEEVILHVLGSGWEKVDD